MTTTSCNLEAGEALCVRHDRTNEPDLLEREQRTAERFVRSQLDVGDSVKFEIRSGRTTRIVYVKG